MWSRPIFVLRADVIGLEHRNMTITETITCPRCFGSGYIGSTGDTCQKCEGSGLLDVAPAFTCYCCAKPISEARGRCVGLCEDCE